VEQTVVLEKRRASDKVVAEVEEEKALIVKHIHRLQVNLWNSFSICCRIVYVKCCFVPFVDFLRR